jgi:hypothetical protein
VLVGGCHFPPNIDSHIPADLRGLDYLTITPAGKILVACFNGNAVYTIDLAFKQASIFIDGSLMGLKDIGNCECDLEGNIWANELEGGSLAV